MHFSLHVYGVRAVISIYIRWGRKPRLLSCSAAQPHRRHERLPSTQNSCVCNEGRLLLLLKLLDTFLSLLALCYCNTSKTIQTPLFLSVSFGNVSEERMCSCLCCMFVCVCICLCATNILDVLPAALTLSNPEHTQATFP